VTATAYSGHLEKSNPKAHNFMSTVGLSNDYKNKFLQFYQIKDYLDENNNPRFPANEGTKLLKSIKTNV
jgi:hypothetical protein